MDSPEVTAAAGKRAAPTPLDELVKALLKLIPGAAPAALNPERAAEHLGLSRNTLDEYAKAGLIPPPVRFGAKVLYCRAELDAWLAHGSPPADEWAPIWKKLRAPAGR